MVGICLGSPRAVGGPYECARQCRNPPLNSASAGKPGNEHDCSNKSCFDLVGRPTDIRLASSQCGIDVHKFETAECWKQVFRLVRGS